MYYARGLNKQDGLSVTRVRVYAVERLLANTTPTVSKYVSDCLSRP
jgi:hypothetical protein